MFNYSLKYRTFDQLLADVQLDFINYTLENYIEPQQLIKVAARCNYDLGLRINMTHEALLDVEKGRVKLPDDFYTLNFAMICGHHFILESFPSGTHIEERNLAAIPKEQPLFVDPCAAPVVCSGCNTTPCGCNPSSASVFACNQPQTTCSSCGGAGCSSCGITGSCDNCGGTGCPSCTTTPTCSDLQFNPLVPFGNICNKPRVFMNCKNECFELIQIVHAQIRRHSVLMPLRIIDNAQGIECGCPNLYIRSKDEAWIKNGFLFTNFNCGKVYINYEGSMQDSDGNLLVPDYDGLNNYYEYALKHRILENLMMNDENVAGKLQLIEQRLKVARNNARNIVLTPNFKEMKELFWQNRRAQYMKYYMQFASYPAFNYGMAMRHHRSNAWDNTW